jgi:hypothetical protein
MFVAWRSSHKGMFIGFVSRHASHLRGMAGSSATPARLIGRSRGGWCRRYALFSMGSEPPCDNFLDHRYASEVTL